MLDFKVLKFIIQLKQDIIDTEIAPYKEFLYEINNFANNEKDKLKDMIEEKVKQNPKYEEDIYLHYSDRYDIYDFKYVELVNNGILVQVYSFFEYQLKDICQILNKFVLNKKGKYHKNDKLSLAENLRDEIATITGLDFSSLIGLWKNLDKYRIVRNIIVHNGANLFEKEGKKLTNQKNYALVTSFAQIKINTESGDFYVTDKELVFDYLELVGDYLKKLLNILKLLDDKDIE